jgi:hypothetical protein
VIVKTFTAIEWVLWQGLEIFLARGCKFTSGRHCKRVTQAMSEAIGSVKDCGKLPPNFPLILIWHFRSMNEEAKSQGGEIIC